MAEKEYRVDLNLHGNEVTNFAVHNVDPSSILHPVNGQAVFFEGKLYLYDEDIPAWVEQGVYSDIEALQQALASEVSARESADNALGVRIDNVVSDLSDEVSRATTAEGVLQDNIDAEEEARIAADNTKVDKEIQGTNGKAIIFNEADGGGAKFEHNDGTESFVGVNDGGENGLAAQIYADKLVGGKWQGAKLDVTNGGMYYTVGSESFANRAVPANELAVKGDVSAEEARALAAEADLQQQISEKDSLPPREGHSGEFLTNDGTDALWAALPEYSISKDAQAETGYAHTYHLTKDGVNVGASINIPKDIVVESGTVETCVQDDVPVAGYKVGDKYIDLVLANSSGSHIYILVTDLIDVYTGSTYIDIINNVVSLKYSVLETKLQDTFYTESEIDTKVSALEASDTALDQAKADKATTLAGYGITDAYTKTEIDSIISGKKQVESCPALTASGNQFTWTINNTVGADAMVSIYESGVEVIADVTITASTVTIKMNQTEDLQSITAGQFKAVILG